jgi:2-polyprenyl-6-hydroxyphenyl methylase/3-demethylubiquinone-9 3-methyltransferase
VGCGGGILAEIDGRGPGRGCEAWAMADKPLRVAELHALECGIGARLTKDLLAQDLASAAAGRLRPAWSPAWRCWNTVPDPEVDDPGLRRAGQARWPAVLLDDQPKPQGFPVRDRRRRIRPAPVAPRHPQYEKFIKPSELAGAARGCGLE